MRELQRRRQATNVFAGKHGFITPRDLFKWAERGAVGYQVMLAASDCLALMARPSENSRALHPVGDARMPLAVLHHGATSWCYMHKESVHMDSVLRASHPLTDSTTSSP